ncbi:DNA polymerase III subunit delta [Magnetococcales bacterium HHB-1]
MKLSIRDFQNRWQQDRLPHVILLHGKEQGLVQENFQRLHNRLLQEELAPNEEDRDFDTASFHGDQIDDEQLIISCGGKPLFSKRRVIVVKDAEKLSTGGRNVLINYIKDPLNTTCLLITADILETKNPLRRACDYSKNAWSIAFFPLEGNSFQHWLQEWLRTRNLRTTPDVMRALHDRLKGNTRFANQELSKLNLYLGDERQFTLEHVNDILGETPDQNHFELVEVLLQKNTPRALTMIRHYIASGEEPIMLIGLTLNRLRRIAQGQAAIARREPVQAVLKRLHVFWKEEQSFLAICRNLSREQMSTAFMRCLEADIQLKGGSQRPKIEIMEQWAINMFKPFDPVTEL